MKAADTGKQLSYTFTHILLWECDLYSVCVFLYKKLAGFKTDEMASSSVSLGDTEENAALWASYCRG